jgi:hypothetical protein
MTSDRALNHRQKGYTGYSNHQSDYESDRGGPGMRDVIEKALAIDAQIQGL